MACSFAFFTLFHLSLTFFRPEVPLSKSYWLCVVQQYLFAKVLPKVTPNAPYLS